MAKSFSKFLLAGLAGLAVGFAAGVLMAPNKGSKSRKRLKKKFREIQDIVKEVDLSDTLGSLTSIFTKNKDQSNP